ncbi:hypothetical protein Clacol_009506 [Clathrus columnatus]|uniref:Uncharacterized protein n=1 Tax=Clathrus columnatus TaxID=1419009 RepID=A0AAV5AR15_9AGAM|nr:hypothetical protein Clacol_009506 [Clathrus columnatus]
MVTNASPSESALSKINGLSQMAIILPQAVAPATATALFAYSIKSQIIRGHLIWAILFSIGTLCFFSIDQV